MLEKQQQVIHPQGAPNGMLHRISKMATWPFSRLCRVSDPSLFQMALVAALWAIVLGNCDPPPLLPFAFPISVSNQTDFRSGTVLRYSCRPGYSRSSSSQTLTCKSDGQWHQQISCTKKRCGNPGDLPNGKVDIKTDLFFGSKIEFSCLEGYILIGSPTSSCVIKDKGVTWSDPLPECIIAKCEPPPDISNGKHSGGDQDFYTYGSSVTYSCNPNFSLLGSTSIFCTVLNKTQGVWTPSPPTCENGCTDIPAIPHASWEHPIPTEEHVYRVGHVLRYYCHPGYEPATNEPTTVTCQRNFRWSSFKGCKERCCPMPELKNLRIIRHKRAHPPNDCVYHHQDEVTYTCSEKQETATCKADGTWHPRTPSCDYSCSFPPNIAHGHYEVTSDIFGDKVIYKCDEGYRLIGESKFSCVFSQRSPVAPQCKALCLKPKIEHGSLSLEKDQFVESENISIHCNSGFALVGLQSITCSENRTWYPEVPKCEWMLPEGCEHVLKGKELMQCLPMPSDVKMAMEIYKLSLEIELLKLQIDQEKSSILK